MKLNRNSKIFINYFLGPLLFLWLSWSIYRQIKNQDNLETAWAEIKESFSGPLLWNLIAVIGLMIVNWFIEAIKFKISVHSLQQISYFKAFKAVLTGVSFSVSTPNRIGEYLGRVLYMNEGNRLKTISITIVGSLSQLLITLLAGLIGLMVLRAEFESKQLLSPPWMQVVIYGVLAVLLGLSIIYFRMSWLVKWINRLPGAKKFSWLIKALEDFNSPLLLKLIGLSTIRFIVFIIQFWLIFPVFGVELGWWACFWTVSVSFLVMAIIPTIAIMELPLRENVMTTILSIYTVNSLGVGIATAAIWVINLIIPAIVGTLLMLGLRKLVGKKESEEIQGLKPQETNLQ